MKTTDLHLDSSAGLVKRMNVKVDGAVKSIVHLSKSVVEMEANVELVCDGSSPIPGSAAATREDLV